MANSTGPKIAIRVDLSPPIYRALEKQALKAKTTKRQLIETALRTLLNLPEDAAA